MDLRCYLVSVSHNGHCDLRFIDTCAVRFEEIKIDIAGMQNETDFLEILRRKKKTLRKQHKKNILLSIVLSGTGPYIAYVRKREFENYGCKSLKMKRKANLYLLCLTVSFLIQDLVLI